MLELILLLLLLYDGGGTGGGACGLIPIDGISILLLLLILLLVLLLLGVGINGRGSGRAICGDCCKTAAAGIVIDMEEVIPGFMPVGNGTLDPIPPLGLLL